MCVAIAGAAGLPQQPIASILARVARESLRGRLVDLSDVAQGAIPKRAQRDRYPHPRAGGCDRALQSAHPERLRQQAARPTVEPDEQGANAAASEVLPGRDRFGRVPTAVNLLSVHDDARTRQMQVLHPNRLEPLWPQREVPR